MLVKYDPKNEKFIGIIESFQKLTEVEPPTDSVLNWFDKLDNGGNILEADLDYLSKQFGETGSSAIDFAKAVQEGTFTLDSGQNMLQNYNRYMVETGQATEAAAIKTKLFTVAAKAASMIGWMIVITAVTAAISALVKALDNYIHRSELLVKASDEAINKIKELRDELTNTKKTTDDLKKSFAELSKGVDLKTGQNVNLSQGDYEEFLNVNRELIDLYPTLNHYYDEEGNALIDINSYGGDLNKTLSEMYEWQRKITLQEIANELPDAFNGAAEKVRQYREEIDKLKKSENALEQQAGNISDALNKAATTGSMEFKDLPWNDYMKILNQLSDAFEKYGIAFSHTSESYVDPDTGAGLNTLKIEVDKDSLRQSLDTIEAEFNGTIDKTSASVEKSVKENEAKIKQTWSKLNDSLYAWMETDFLDGMALPDQMQKGVQQAVSGIDWSQVFVDGNFDWDDAKAYLEDNLSKWLDDANVRVEMSKLFAMDKDSVPLDEYYAQVEEVIKAIQDHVDANEDGVKVKLLFGIDPDEEQKYKDAISYYKENLTDEALESDTQLKEESKKISKWGLGKYADDIKNKTIQTVFGNVDMDKRTIIEWSNELKETYADALASWDYDPEVGSIDTVFGSSQRFGEDLNGDGWEVAFTPILPDGTFLSKDTVEEYINSILAEAYADDGKVTDDELKEIDAQGRYIGDTFVKGIYAGMDAGMDYGNKGNKNLAVVIGKLMHFVGFDGAWQIAERSKTQQNTNQSVEDWINKLSGKDLDIYYSDQFKKALEEQRQAMNGAALTAEDYEIALRKVKAAQDEVAQSPTVSFDQYMTQLDDVDSKMDKIDEAYSKLFDKDQEIGFEDYSSLYDTFKDIEGLDMENYVNQLRAAGQNASQVKSITEDLIDDYLQCSGSLNGLTESTAALLAKELEEQGVVNGAEIVYAAYNAQLEAAAVQKDYLAAKGIDLANATNEEIASFWNECTASDDAKYYLAQLALEKMAVNNTKIDSVEDIDNIISMANSAMASTGALAKLKKVKDALNSDNPLANLDKDTIETIRQLENGTFDYNFQLLRSSDYMPHVVKGTKSYTNAQNAAKDATKDATDAIKKQKEALEKQKSALEETKKELELLYDAIVWFYDNQSDKIDKQIDKLNDANDALNDQKDTYDAILAAIDKVYQAQIDAIQERIDALDEANDEEEKALELEKARQALEEARRKKNIKVYTKDKGFVYTVDESAIKDAEDDYNNLVDEMQKDEIKKALEDQIEALNKLRDTFADIPKAWEEAMNKLKASEMLGSNWEIDILNPSDDLINNFRNQYTGTQDQIQNNENKISALEKEKEHIEELKQLWEDAKNAYTYQQYEMKLNSFFGSDYEYQLLNNSASWRAKFAADYGDICAQIEALEKQIAALDEETADASASAADKTSEAMGKTAGAIKGASDAAQNAKIGQYIWTDADDYALTSADSRLKELNRLIGDDTSSALIGTRDDIEQFVNSFEHLKTSGEITNSLKDSMNALLSSSDESLYGLQRVLGGVKDRITESEKATQSVKDSSQAAGESIDSLGQKVQTLNGASGAIESEADKAVANTDAALQSALGKIDELKTAMAELNTARTNLQGAVDLAVIDTNRVIVTSNNIVTSLSTEINGLISGLNLLSAALNTLVTRITSLNGLQLTQIVGQFTSSGLLGAITSVVSSLTGANGLIPILQVTLNGTKLTEVIGQFNGEEGLLAAVNSVSTAIFSGDDECLFNRIMNLSTTISTIDTVSEAFRRTCDHINEAKKAVDKLIETINKIPTKKETHHYIYTHRIDARATGTAFTDSHYAAGTANKSGASYAKGSGNWGLTEDQPHSLVAELGPEILVRDSQYFVIPKPQFMDLKKGDIVFNHEQTKAILNGGKASMIEKLDNKANKVVPGILEKKGSSFANGTSPELDVNSLKQKVDNSTFVRSANFGVPMSNQNVGNTTTLQFNGNLSFPNIKSGNDAEKLIRELQNLPNRALQKANKR